MKTFWTIGYERASVADFIAALNAAKIKTVIDVREIANSRRAGFSKKALAASLGEAGIAYVHMNPLGTPKAGREAAHKGDTKTMRRISEAHLAEPKSALALDETAAFVGKGRVCLMCLEHDWRACHRAIIAERLEAAGLKAMHLSPAPS